MAPAMAKRRAGAHHQELAQIAIAHLGDAPKPLFAPARMLARRQAEESGELAPAGEHAGVLDRGHDRRGGDRALRGLRSRSTGPYAPSRQACLRIVAMSFIR